MEQLRNSYLTPAIEEQLVIVLFLRGGGEGHVMPAVSEAKQKDTPTQVITSDGEVHLGPKSQQPSPELELITTRVRPPAIPGLCSQLANSILFHILLFYVCVVSSRFEVLREGNC